MVNIVYLFIYLFIYLTLSKQRHPPNTKQQSYKVSRRYKDIYKVEELGAYMYINETLSLQYTV